MGPLTVAIIIGILYVLWTYVVVPIALFIVEYFWTIFFCIVGLIVLIGIVAWLSDQAKRDRLARDAREREERERKEAARRAQAERDRLAREARERKERERKEAERRAQAERDRLAREARERKERDRKEVEKREWESRCAEIMAELESQTKS